MGKVEFTEGQLSRIKNLYTRGMPIKKIAKYYCVDPETIWRRLRDMGCLGIVPKKQDGQVAIFSVDEVKELYLAGWSQHEISVMLNVGVKRVRNCLVDIGLAQGTKHY